MNVPDNLPLDPHDLETTAYLMECRVCGGKVSSRAVSCPHCGDPIREKAKRARGTTTSDGKEQAVLPPMSLSNSAPQVVPSYQSSYKDFFDAAKKGTVEDVRYFVESKGVDVNVKNGWDSTPLHYAAKYNPDVEVLKYLISAGADVNAENCYGWIPLDLTNMEGKRCILREAWGSPYESLYESIFDAAKNGTVRDMRYFVEDKCVDVNIAKKNGWTPLHIATAYNPDVAIMRYLIFKGANVYAEDMDGEIPLAYADTSEKKSILRYVEDWEDEWE